MKRIAFFDFDGTISKENTFKYFLEFVVGKDEYNKALTLLFPYFLLYKMKILSDTRIKKIISKYFFKDFPKQEFDLRIKEFTDKNLAALLREEALERLAYHKDNGDEIVIVSASFEDFLKFWCQENNFALLGTKLEVKNAYLTGKLASKNCYGEEKVKRIREIYNLEDYVHIFAYGDSVADKKMLELADESFYKPFD